MYQQIYHAYCRLSRGDKASLKRCNLSAIGDSPAYFRVLKYSGAKDSSQTKRILFLLEGTKIAEGENKETVAGAMLAAGVKENHITQITRGGDNGVEYLKRQLIRCENICVDSLGKLAQFWGDTSRRKLLKEFILLQQD